MQILHLTSNNDTLLELQSSELLQRRNCYNSLLFFNVICIISFCNSEVIIMSVADAYKVLSSFSFQKRKGPLKYVDICILAYIYI